MYADKAIEAAFKAHPKWGARDRHFVAETVYECVRWWRKLWAALGESPVLSDDALFRLMSAYWISVGQEPPEFVANLDQNEIKRRIESIPLDSPEGLSIPDWLYDLGQEELGQRWPSVMGSLNQKADVIIRVNLLKTSKESLIAKLREEDIETSPIEGYPLALRLSKRTNIFRTEAFKNGLFEVQDAASQKVVEILDVRPGERVIDACAGAGGKSLHLASLMKNKGKIIALDIYEWKLKELKERARRNGVDVIETRTIDSSKVIKRLEGSAQGLVLDVPCTGLGALRRNPDTKWKLTREEHLRLLELQGQILLDYSRMVAPGGRMVYATCSVLPSEDEKQVQAFLSKAQGWELISEHREWPDAQGFDGFYMALIRRKD